MILGTGTDIVQVARMRRCIERFGDRFTKRILSSKEMIEFNANSKKAHYIARRFAAKEAAVKALGTGFSQGIHFHDVVVTHDDYGKPNIELYGKALLKARDMKVTAIHSSLSDEKEYAVAFVIMTS